MPPGVGTGYAAAAIAAILVPGFFMSVAARSALLPGPSLGYADNPIDRLSEKRDDAAFVASLRADPAARTLLIAGDTPILKRLGEDKGEARFRFEEVAPIDEAHEVALLGQSATGPLFATLIEGRHVEALKLRPELLVSDMRSIAVRAMVPEQDVSAIGMAKALMDWHSRHRFCARCGTPTKVGAAGWRRECEACGAQHFPRTDPVVIMMIHRGDKCLLARQPRFVPNMYSCIAGFLEPGETIEDAVRRETKEEVGLIAGRVRYLMCQPWPFPSSLMIGCLAEALSDEITIDTTELEDGRWFSREEAALILAGRHPDGLTCPPPVAIAHHLMRAWIEGESA